MQKERQKNIKLNINLKKGRKAKAGFEGNAVFKAFTVLLIACCVQLVNAQNADFVWAKSMGGTGLEASNSVAVDGNGNVFVTGQFSVAGADFNPGGSSGALTSAGGNDVFIAKYDPSGIFLWAKSMGGTGSDVGRGLAVDGNGNVYVTGQIAAAGADFNPGGSGGALISAGGNEVFVAKYDSSGTFLWAKSMGGTGNDVGNKIAVDGSGNVLVTGYFAAAGGEFNRGGSGGALVSAGGNEAFVAKYDPSGAFIWAKAMGGTGSDIGNGVAVDGNDDVYVIGALPAAGGDFNRGGSGGALTSAGGIDVFVAKYSSSGAFLWAKSMGGPEGDQGYGITVDINGNVYITGQLPAGGGDFNPGGSGGALTSAGGIDAFVAKYDSSGTFLWAKSMGGLSSEQGWGIATDQGGNAYVTGYYLSVMADFNPGGSGGQLITSGAIDVFVAKYSPNGTFLWAKGMGGTGADQGWGVAVNDNDGSVYVTGQFAAVGADFNPGGSDGALTSAGGDDVYIVKFACNDTTSSYLAASIECGTDYTLNGEIYNSRGIHTQHFPNASGCDSTVILELTTYVVPVITIEINTLSTTESYTTYQWIKGGIDIPGATNAQYTVTANADYQVRVMGEDGCAGTSEIYTVTNAGSSIDEMNNIGQSISIYPNPANDVLYINSPVPIHATLCSIEGRSVLHIENATAIPVSDLAKGIYLLRLTDKNGTLIKVEKLVKGRL